LKGTREELSQLGAALDDMAAQLEQRESELQHALNSLTEQAMTDPLTGLYNRRFFWDALTREIAAAKRKRVPFSVIELDLDHFKRVNDAFGHDAGDTVLKEIAALLKASIRDSDIAVRHGGEEFAILLPETALSVAIERAERLRRALERHEVRYGAHTLYMTASFGVAESPAGQTDAAALMKTVDAAMYAAKAAGRNRVVAPQSSSQAAAESSTRPPV
jgi:diguanylate cyclase (GGDEF)-like protein